MSEEPSTEVGRRKPQVWLWVIGAIIVAAVVYAVIQSASSKPQPGQNSATQVPKSAATVTYGASGFTPALTTVTSGDAVTFKNTSSQTVQVDSDPHPVHTDDPDLNVGTLSPGQSSTVTLNKKGSFGIHNHLSPSETAKISIQ